MARPDSVEHWWLTFSTAVMPPDAPPVQHQEMRSAFYAGVWATLTASQQIIGDPEITEDEGVRMLEGWHQECRAFQRAIHEGKA